VSLPVNEIYVFGDFRLDPAEHLLTRQGQQVPLAPKVFDTLVILVQNAGQLITKDDFIKQLWPGVFVEEVALAQNISQLRKALGDSAEGPQMIQTVPKRGYRFTLPVRVERPSGKAEEKEALPDRTLATPSSDRRAASPLKRAVFVLAALIIFLVATLSFQWITQPSEPRVLRMNPLTSSGRAEPWGGIQVDGSRLYFLERQGSAWRLMQTSVTGGEPSSVNAPFPNTRIFDLSSDRAEFLVGNFVDLSGNMPLWIMPAQGGPPRRVGDIMVDDAAWFPGGKRILATLRGEIFSVEPDGRNRRPWFSVDGEAVGFSWRPDGQAVRFTVRDHRGDLSLWEAFTNDSSPHPLLPDWNSPHGECCGAWMPDGKEYVFSAIREGKEEVWVLREAVGLFHSGRRRPLRLAAGPYDFSLPVPSPDGKRIFVFAVQDREKLVRFDAQRGDFQPLPFSGIHVAISRDGEWAVYVGADGMVWRSRSDGTERMQLTSAPLQSTTPRWSPDGKRVLFVGQTPDRLRNAYVVSREGGALVPVSKGLRGGFADWMPDGESIVIDSSESAGSNNEISIVHLASGEISKIPGSGGMVKPLWSPDGRYLAAMSADARTLNLYDARQRRWTRLATLHLLTRFEWRADSRGLYFQDILDPQEAIFRWDAGTGKIDRVFDFSKLLQTGAIRCGFEGFARDGSYLASVRSDFSNVYVLDVEMR
jgi:DNA-binding winged helix-turn-helix (wHTH) protein/Tol biopolymer transport system component